MKNEKRWDITEKQFNILSNCQKLNEIILIKPNSDIIISVDALDESFNTIYINKSFGFTIDKEVIIHNLSEILKSVKNIDNAKIVFSNERISVTDSEGTVKCNYQYAADDIINGIRFIYDAYEKIINGVENGDNLYEFEMNINDFNVIKKFISFGHNTLSYTNGKIIIFDNTAGNEIEEKDTVEIKIKESDTTSDDFRLDLDISLFKKIEPGNYKCILSGDDGLSLFKQIDGDNIYGIVSNKI